MEEVQSTLPSRPDLHGDGGGDVGFLDPFGAGESDPFEAVTGNQVAKVEGTGGLEETGHLESVHDPALSTRSDAQRAPMQMADSLSALEAGHKAALGPGDPFSPDSPVARASSSSVTSTEASRVVPATLDPQSLRASSRAHA